MFCPSKQRSFEPFFLCVDVSVGGSTKLPELFPPQNLKLVDFKKRHVETGVREQDCVLTTMPPPMTRYQYHRPSSPISCWPNGVSDWFSIALRPQKPQAY